MTEPELQVVYDDGCPFCSRFVSSCDKSGSEINLEKVGARSNPLEARALLDSGVDLDDAIVVKIGEEKICGAHAMAYLLARTGTRTRLRETLAKVFAGKLGPTVYRGLVFLRRVYLRMSGQTSIRSLIRRGETGE